MSQILYKARMNFWRKPEIREFCKRLYRTTWGFKKMCFHNPLRYLAASVIVLFSLLFEKGYAEFGYISYSTTNIGDDVQAYAARRFLPKKSVPIDREFVGVFRRGRVVRTIVNGWFMHTKDFGWYRADVRAPKKSWPPSSSIDPLFISLHFADGFRAAALTDTSVNYLKQHGPIGARDYVTLAALQEKGVPSYFSGCLTLTLDNPCRTRNDIIYVVDLDDECLAYLRSTVQSEIRVVHHGLLELPSLTNGQRMRYVKKLLRRYGHAKCVVTTRLHAVMPCLAIKTPVLLVLRDENDSRFVGLKELARWCTKEDFLHGKYDFNFDAPTENPTTYLALRKNLIKTVTRWVKKKS